MASEISWTAKITASKGGSTVTNATSTKSSDMTTGTNMVGDVTTFAAGTKTAIPVGSVDPAKEFVVLLRNQHTTDYVEVTSDDGTSYPYRIYPGEFFGPVRVAANIVIKVRANTTAADVNVIVCEAF